MTRPRTRLYLFASGIAVVALLWVSGVHSFEQYSVDRNSGNCADCHGNFRSGFYNSFSDGVGWGTNLHDGHRWDMLAGDCNTCHMPSGRFPVTLNQSAGGVGFDPIGCIGCHGRPEEGRGVAATGLRQHHFNAGVQLCGSPNCHVDGNPANFTPAGEDVMPPYYFAGDATHPNKPKSACNTDQSESTVAPPRGLDNDGDLLYDGDDPDCVTTPAAPTTWGRVKGNYR